MPCFGPKQAPLEGIIIGRLLAGYGELELAMCECLMTIERAIDSPIRTLFEKRGEEKRIKTGDLLPNLPSFIRRVCSSFAPARGVLRTRLV